MSLMETTVCRICLSSDMRLCKIAGTPLQVMFEKITGYTLQNGKRPVKVCYICQAQLIRCHKLRATAAEAEAVLSSVSIHPETTSLPELVSSQPALRVSLRTRPVECTDTVTYPVPIEVKSEPVEVKNEPDDVENQPVGVTNASVGVKKALLEVTKNSVEVMKNSVGVTKNSAAGTKNSVGVTKNSAAGTKNSVGVTKNSVGFTNTSVGVTKASTEVTKDPAEVGNELIEIKSEHGLLDDLVKHELECDVSERNTQTAQQEAASIQSVKMLIFLANGEQRLVTFTLPKESCALQEVLEMVNIPFKEDTNIQCMQSERSVIDYFVSVGCPERLEDLLEEHPMLVAAEESPERRRLDPRTRLRPKSGEKLPPGVHARLKTRRDRPY